MDNLNIPHLGPNPSRNARLDAPNMGWKIRDEPGSNVVVASKKVDDLSHHESKHSQDPKQDPKHNAREKALEIQKPHQGAPAPKIQKP
jgi:hypothetical protein